MAYVVVLYQFRKCVGVLKHDYQWYIKIDPIALRTPRINSPCIVPEMMNLDGTHLKNGLNMNHCFAMDRVFCRGPAVNSRGLFVNW